MARGVTLPPQPAMMDDLLSSVEDRSLEDELFEFLDRKYVQSQEPRHKRMGLQYMGAETHDLAKEIVRFLRRRRKN